MTRSLYLDLRGPHTPTHARKTCTQCSAPATHAQVEGVSIAVMRADATVARTRQPHTTYWCADHDSSSLPRFPPLETRQLGGSPTAPG